MVSLSRRDPRVACLARDGTGSHARALSPAELADTQDTLDEKEKAELKRALDDIVRDTAKTPAAAERFKVLASKAGKGALN